MVTSGKNVPELLSPSTA